MNEAAVHIRRMVLDDIPRIFAIESAAHTHPWTEAILTDCLRAGYIAFVLEAQNTIIGFVIMTFVTDECHLLNLAVDPELQSQGYGSQLLLHTLGLCQELDMRVIYLEVRKSNQAAINLYAKFNFVCTGERKNYYQSDGGREDALMLKLELKT